MCFKLQLSSVEVEVDPELGDGSATLAALTKNSSSVVYRLWCRRLVSCWPVVIVTLYYRVCE